MSALADKLSAAERITDIAEQKQLEVYSYNNYYVIL